MADDNEQSHTQRKRKQEVREFKQRQTGHRTNLTTGHGLSTSC